MPEVHPIDVNTHEILGKKVSFVEGFDLKVFLQPLKMRTDQHTRLDDHPDLEFIETAA